MIPTEEEIQSRAEAIRQQLRKGEFTMQLGNSTIPGTFTIECRHADMAVPLGTVWFRHVGHETLEVLNSFVHELFRRCGLRTAMHNQLLAYWPSNTRIITDGGTKDGLAWMASVGFVATPDWWEFRREVPA